MQVTVDAWLATCTDLATEVAKGYVSETYHYILETSPQFSGDFVANWNLSLMLPDNSFVHLHPVSSFAWFRSPRYGEGDREAIDKALSRARAAFDGFRLGVPVFFTNASAHDDEPYALKIEANTIEFRPVNVSGGAVMYRAQSVMRLRYNQIGPTGAAQLMGVKL